MASLLRRCLLSTPLISAATSAVLPPRVEGGSTVKSILDPNISLSFKETHICETTPGVKSYSGYVNLPADQSAGRDYDIHTFFWFFESRNDPANAPLSLWLQGGPGAPSMTAALGENGPCYVTPDSSDTTLNPWSWNTEVNMLYIDQPVQTGFSYDTLINGTIDETGVPYIVTPQETYEDKSAYILAGKFPSQDTKSTPDTASTAAVAAWHFMQTWMQEFPVYTPKDNKFSIWGESYGGHYIPTFSDFFESQNQKIADDSIDESAVPLRLDTVGIVNGCIDILTQMPFYPPMAHNNTYGIQISNETEYQLSVEAWPACKAAIESCHSLAADKDPQRLGKNEDVNKGCSSAMSLCFKTMRLGYDEQKTNVFDLTTAVPGSFPPKYAAGYLNSRPVQEALGVPLNFTGLSTASSVAFTATGDFVLGRNLAILGELLDRGVKVALMYGDRDYQCNWLGGEAISLAIESNISAQFHKAGYTELKTNDEYVGGMVRQYGNLSFTRVFSAGHEVPWYQPETAYEIFRRVMSNKDVATGKIATDSSCGSKLATKGATDISHVTNEMPAPHRPECYFWDMMETCTSQQIGVAKKGMAIFEDFVMTRYDLGNGTVVRY